MHSLKDLPTAAADGIALAAVPPREDPRDVVVARDGLTLGELPAGSRVGTGSPRRAAQLHALGLGLDVVGVRGNVDTRVGKVRAGEFDAVCSPAPAWPASAGSRRSPRCSTRSRCCPRPARARSRSSAAPTTTCVAAPAPPSTTRATRAAVDAERAVLAALEAGCSAPIGALAEVVEGEDGDELWLRAVALSPDGALVGAAVGAPARPTTPPASAPGSPRSCSPTAPPT